MAAVAAVVFDGLQFRHAIRSLEPTESAACTRCRALSAQSSRRLSTPALVLAVRAFHEGALDKATHAFGRGGWTLANAGETCLRGGHRRCSAEARRLVRVCCSGRHSTARARPEGQVIARFVVRHRGRRRPCAPSVAVLPCTESRRCFRNNACAPRVAILPCTEPRGCLRNNTLRRRTPSTHRLGRALPRHPRQTSTTREHIITAVCLFLAPSVRCVSNASVGRLAEVRRVACAQRCGDLIARELGFFGRGVSCVGGSGHRHWSAGRPP